VIAFWIALKPTPATSGTMRFVAPRDFDQPLHDLVHATYAEEKSIEDSYQELQERGILSPPLDLKPGDATIHRGALHSAPPNNGDGIRWAFAVSYVQADVRYTGIIDELVMAGVEGLEAGEPLPDHRFHIIA
jgi:ectoine hydroxylase-related dioxygenase (phytanoyl-CoA dioxygenase family)